MGYAQEKKEQDNIKKRIKIYGILVATIIGAILSILGLFGVFSGLQYRIGAPSIDARENGEMRMHFLNVGQGDSTLIELPDGKVALIDSGNGSKSANQALLRQLYALKIKEIDYLIITHVDNDHAGGVKELLQYKKVKRAYLPFVTENDYDYDILLSTITEKDVPYYTACPPDVSRVETLLSVTDGQYPYTFAFLYPTTEMVDNGATQTDSNALSSVLWLDYQGTSTLFMGDAPQEIEHKLILDDNLGLFERYGVTLSQTEILKVSHHGSADATSQALLDYIHAETAIISCGKDNAYQHPNSDVVERLVGAGVGVYRTDVQGTIVISVKQDGAYQAFSVN